MLNKMIIATVLSSSILISSDNFVDESLSNSWFMGVEYPVVSNMNMKIEFSGDSMDNDYTYQPLVIKLGFGKQGGYNQNIYFSSAKPDFDGSGEDSNPINELGYDMRYEFDISKKGFYPFIQGGFSYGWQKIDDNEYINFSEDSIKFFGLKVGAGLSYYINNNFQLLAGIDYKYLNWQDIKIYNYNDPFKSITLNPTSSGTQINIGANFWF